MTAWRLLPHLLQHLYSQRLLLVMRLELLLLLLAVMLHRCSLMSIRGHLVSIPSVGHM